MCLVWTLPRCSLSSAKPDCPLLWLSAFFVGGPSFGHTLFPLFHDEGNRVLVPVFGRGLAGMAAEECAERRGIAEGKMVCDLLYGEVGLAQENRSFRDNHVGDSLAGAFARVMLADMCQVMGGYVQFPCVESHFVFLDGLGLEQGEEAVAKQCRP